MIECKYDNHKEEEYSLPVGDLPHSKPKEMKIENTVISNTAA